MKLFNNILLFVGICFSLHNIFADTNKQNDWGDSNGKIEIESVSVEKKNVDSKVLGALIKESGKQLNELLEPGEKTVKTFKIIYQVSIKKDNNKEDKKIEQYGIVKTLPTKIQDYFNKDNVSEIHIQYKINDPIIIRFVIDGEIFDAPALLTDFNKVDEK